MMQENKIKEAGLWLAVLLVTGAGLFATYRMALTPPVVAMVWIGWLVLTGALAYFTANGQRVLQFARDAKIELQKVVWPTRQETVQTTIVVMVMVCLTGMILWGIDSLMMWAIAGLTYLG